MVGVEHVDELGEPTLGVGHVAAGNKLAGLVNDRDGEGIFVGVYSGDHEGHLLFGMTAGPATRKHSGAAILAVALCPKPLSGVFADHHRHREAATVQSLTTAGGQHQVEPSR